MKNIESPSINGFTITNLKMMESTDGYAIRCNLKRDGKKIGEFLDKGDGGMYDFYPVSGVSQREIEDYLFKFPMIESYEGLPAIHWNMGILIDKLIEKLDVKDAVLKTSKRGVSLIYVVDDKKGRAFTMNTSVKTTDEQIEGALSGWYGDDAKYFEWARYNSVDELNETYPLSVLA